MDFVEFPHALRRMACKAAGFNDPYMLALTLTMVGVLGNG